MSRAVSCVTALTGATLALSFLLDTAGPNPARAAPLSFPEKVEAAARALDQEPRLKHLTMPQRRALTEFVVGNMLFVIVHELGHAVVSELDVPVLGREEDAADSFAIITGIKMDSEFSHRVLVEAAKGWFLTDKRDVKDGEPMAYYDEHGLNKQRAYQIVCLMVGSDPEKFKDLAEETKLPEERQASCRRDFRTALRSWNAVLAPHRRAPDAPKTPFTLTYSEGKGDLAIYERTFRDIGFLEAIAQRAMDGLDWNGPMALELRTCGEVNAYWWKPERKVHICYEMIQEFAQLYRDYGPDKKMRLAKRAKSRP